MKVHGGGLRGPDGSVLPLSSAVEVDDLVFLSGQLALRDDRLECDVTEQAEAVFDAIEAALGELGLGLDHIVRATVWLTEAADFAAFNQVYARRLRAPYPARSCVVSQLVVRGARVEVEVLAHRRHTRD